MVLVDTSVWSLALRRTPDRLNERERKLVEEWRRLIDHGQALLVGPIRQEILSGIREEFEFERLRDHLRAFNDVPIQTGDYEEAARLFNRCRSRGVVGTPIDLLMCAVAHRLNLDIFTTDRDFEHNTRDLPIRLHARRVAFPGSLK